MRIGRHRQVASDRRSPENKCLEQAQASAWYETLAPVPSWHGYNIGWCGLL
jgi:hypothetical protein